MDIPSLSLTFLFFLSFGIFMSHKVTVVPGANGGAPTAVVEDAKIIDILSTVLSTDAALTGTYGLLQKTALFVGGMSVQNKRRMGSFNPL